MHSSQRLDSLPKDDIWTPELEHDFYTSISQLIRQKTKQPRKPESYSPDTIRIKDEYLLPLEEELCFADQVAFLASCKEGVAYVSAATVQERKMPPAILILLASNETVESDVTQKLQEIFKVLEAYAGRKIKREQCQSRLFDIVFLLSAERIHGRLCSSKWKPPAHRPFLTPKDAPLYQRLQQILEMLVTSVKKHKLELKELRQKLKELCSHYQAIENQSSASAETNLLKEAICKTHDISTLNGHSLEASLKRMGVDTNLCEGRIILQIDKIGRYWGLCKSMTRLCRQPKSRELFKTIKLEICTPFGCLYRYEKPRFVHAEIQIIFSLEKAQVIPFPRVIGASKSACFLCDLFIRQHRTFRFSHSHNMLYDQWTVPEALWMDVIQRDRFRNILMAMIREMQRILRSRKPANNHVFQNIQSRAHLLLRAEAPETPSEMTMISEAKTEEEIETPIHVSPFQSKHVSEQSLVSLKSTSTATSVSTIKSIGFPVQHTITLASKPLHISTSRAELFFRFTDVQIGSLEINKSDTEKGQIVDIRNLPMDRDVSFELDGSQDKMFLCMADGASNLLNLTFSWN